VRLQDLTPFPLVEVVDDGIAVCNCESRKGSIPCNTVALAVGLTPRREVYSALKGEITDLHLVGDSKEPRKIMDAIWDGFHAACS
jgi:2-enoate reductase